MTNAVQAPYNIIIVGETGVGKSSFLTYLANVLLGNDIDHYDSKTLNCPNQQGGAGNQSDTNSARLYELMSKNGMVVSAGILSAGWLRNPFSSFGSLTSLG